jgi:hypothetical protein
MAFVYPAQASNLASQQWRRFQDQHVSGQSLAEKDGSQLNAQPPFPSNENLELILDTVYHASFLVEEGRRLFIRLLYLHPNV